MTFPETMLLAVGLACDASAVGLAVGTRWNGPGETWRLSFSFGLFQFAMPLGGWWLGKTLGAVMGVWAAWVAAGVLVLIGVRMLLEGRRKEEDRVGEKDPTRGVVLLLLSFATSVDAWGAGMSLGLLGESVWMPAFWIGVTAAGMTWAAVRVGRFLSQRWGQWMSAAGGGILIGIALRLVL